jgi:hypothetical protein
VTVYQETTIRWTPSRIFALWGALLVLLAACSSAGAGPGPQIVGIPPGGTTTATQASPEQEAAAGVALICEVYCSETKLRTANARIRWKLVPGPALDAAKAANLSRAEQRLETTVYKNGFAKDLYVSLPVSQAGYERAVPSSALAKQGQGTLRAYQIRIVDIERPKSTELFAAGSEETLAVVENLEPGMNYTWRLVIQTDADQVASPTVTCQAPVCPADMVREREP